MTGWQPPPGGIERPYSALGLRRVLAWFGVVVCTAAVVVLAVLGHVGWSIAFAIPAAIAVIDLVVLRRRRRSRQQSPSTPP